VHRNLLTFEGKVDRTAVLGVMANWLFNYNTVRARGAVVEKMVVGGGEDGLDVQPL
jgi:hypothetical protein